MVRWNKPWNVQIQNIPGRLRGRDVRLPTELSILKLVSVVHVTDDGLGDRLLFSWNSVGALVAVILAGIAGEIFRPHLCLERFLRLPLYFPDVVHRQTVPFVLPRPRLSMRANHRLPQRDVVDESLQLRLHSPVAELDAAELVRAHDGFSA